MSKTQVKNDVDVLVDEMSEPKETASPASKTDFKGPDVSEKLSEDRDTAGNKFDPDIHLTGPNGEPVLTKTGRFRKIPKTSKSKIADVSGPTDLDKPQQTAIALVSTYTSLSIQFGGAKYKMADQEFLAHVQAWRRVAEQHPDWDLPPWVGVAVCLTTYYGTRLEPKTVGGLAGKIKKFLGKGQKKKE